MLDMGIVAASKIRTATGLNPQLLSFGVFMPMIGAVVVRYSVAATKVTTLIEP